MPCHKHTAPHTAHASARCCGSRLRQQCQPPPHASQPTYFPTNVTIATTRIPTALVCLTGCTPPLHRRAGREGHPPAPLGPPYGISTFIILTTQSCRLMLYHAVGSGGEEDDPAAIERFRTANNFRRRPDGRVLLWGRGGGAWMEAKLDGYVEGEWARDGRVAGGGNSPGIARGR